MNVTNGLPASRVAEIINSHEVYRREVTLLANKWSVSGTIATQSVSVSGMTTSSNIDIAMKVGVPITTINAVMDAQIQPTAIANGSITFTCLRIPAPYVDVPLVITFSTMMEASGSPRVSHSFPQGTRLFSSSQTNVGGAFYYGDTPAPVGNIMLNYNGYFRAVRVINAYMADYAEAYSVEDEAIVGDVVGVDKNQPGKLVRLKEGQEDFVVGVVSDSWAHCIGYQEGYVPVGLVGRLPVQVVGPVAYADRLCLSSYPGICRVAHDNERCIGIAMEDSPTSPTGVHAVEVFLKKG